MEASLAELQRIFEAALTRHCAKLPAQPANLYDPVRYTLELPGKRLRPLLALISCRMFSSDLSPALQAALGIELFHNCTLLHDDIMDRAPIRRGRPSVHAKWNESIAILSGDAMLVDAYACIAQTPAHALPAVLKLFGQTALHVCEGQQLDMDYEKTPQVRLDDYLRMIELKTAVLLAASLEIGARCGGAEESEAKKLYEFGRHVGIAFQLQDDILDVYADAKKFGKQPGGDIITGKKTFLLLKAFELADPYRKEELQNWLAAPRSAAAEKVKAVTEIYDYLGVREHARKELHAHYETGIAQLDAVKGGEEWKKLLRGFTDSLMVREA